MLKTLYVQHYRSLADVRVDFSPITVLVGPNGSGKSNVVDALRFIRDAIVHGLDHAISERGGIDVLRQYSPTAPYVLSLRIDFETEAGMSDQVFPASYSFRIRGSGSNYRVEGEEASWYQKTYVLDDEEESDTSQADLLEEESGQEIVVERKFRRNRDGKVSLDGEDQKFVIPPDQLGIRSATHRFTSDESYFGPSSIVGYLSRLRFASIYPNILRDPTRPDTDRLLKENCANWASVLKAMRQRKPGEQMLHRIMELMRKVMPGLEQVTVKLIGGYLVPQFLVKDTPEAEKGHFFDPVQLSDGTLRLFGIFLSLYQLPRPGFLAMEEPELTIHPGLVALLADAFKEVSAQTQLLVTTHSPYLLDHFDPVSIKVVTMVHGETHISSVRRSQIESVKEGLMTLSEVMALDGLRPE